MKTIPDLLKIAARDFPTRGVTFLGPACRGERFISYAVLFEKARAGAAALIARGVSPGARVVISLDDNADILEAFWAVQLAGATALVLPRTVSTTPAARARLVESIKVVGEVHWLDSLPTGGEGAVLPEVSPEAIALICLSSGSTGVAKAAAISHRNLFASLAAVNAHCEHREDDVVFNWLPFDHIGGISDWHLRPMALGNSVVYAHREDIAGTILRWPEVIERFGITHTWAPNFAYRELDAALPENGTSPSLASLRFLLTTGEPIAFTVWQSLLPKLEARGLARHVVCTAFGMTELSGAVTYSRTAPGKFLRSTGALVTGGSVVPTAELKVTGSNGESGAPGRLHVRGPMVFAGYYDGRGGITAMKDADGWFETGDLAFFVGPELYLVAREKAVLIVRGEKLPYGEIEAKLGGKVTIAVKLVGSDRIVTDREAIVVFYSDADPRAIATATSREFGFVPDYFVSVPAEQIPRTSIGKISRPELLARWTAGEWTTVMANGLVEEAVAGPDAHADADVQKMIEIWRADLGSPALGAADDFFELGGNSLIAARILASVQGAFSVHLPIRAIFDHPSPELLTAHVASIR